MARIRKANKNSNMMVTRAMSGGGDLTMASLTIINESDVALEGEFPVCYEAGEMDEEAPACIFMYAYVSVGETVTFNVPLYKGLLIIENVFGGDVEFSGDIEAGEMGINITGDCTAKIGGGK